MKVMFFEWSLAILLSIQLLVLASELEMIDYESQHVTYSKGLSNCTVKACAGIPIQKCPVDVKGLAVQPVLCCRQDTACRPCLHIRLDIQPRDDQTASYVSVCYTVPQLIMPLCKKLEFTVIPAAPDEQASSKQAWLSLLLESNALSFSSQVTVYACNLHSTVILPSVDEVCSSASQGVVEECEVPSFSTLIDPERREVMLQVAKEEDSPYQLEMCLQHEHNGMCRTWKEKSLPLHSVTPCMCFQLWWDKGDERSRRSRSCPFRNNTELFQRNLWENVSVSVVRGQMNSGGAMLSWNLTAPCRVEAEVWPCQRDAGVDKDRCRELGDIRQHLSNDIWREIDRGHWLMPGVFEDVKPGLDLCVMVKVKGKNSELGPFCPIDSRWWHWRWGLVVLVTLMLVGLAGICLYFLHGKLKRWAWEWHQKECDQLPIRGHVVLLSPPDVDNSVSELVCELGSSLRARGLSVSVDLWSRAELCSLGPLPWLHSQLQPLDSQGGRALLVLTQAAWKKAEDWGQQWDQHGQQRRDIAQGVEEEGEYKRLLQGLYSPYADVFSAALSCIKVDHQQGRAGKRFLLVHFEAHSAKLLSSERGPPELFQGLPLFHLPSQGQELLVQLAIGSKGPRAGIGG
ncbi:uncharacterized protein il17rc isoform X1 [Oncorhynchus tshawytscha]|uniref:uncharacterized protein il17rc isoform X1 n=1 Tax=Oncorhynchus tshawytscha TaxID=74940 RepID=UPI000D0A7EE8|nr:uncharacterized protein il17rc isoform X1 [Oncorhynchus tshawytscha]